MKILGTRQVWTMAFLIERQPLSHLRVSHYCTEIRTPTYFCVADRYTEISRGSCWVCTATSGAYPASFASNPTSKNSTFILHSLSSLEPLVHISRFFVCIQHFIRARFLQELPILFVNYFVAHRLTA